MLSQTFCYWDKKESADDNIIQFHLTLKCTKDQPSNFCEYFLVSKWIFHQHDRGLSKFHAGSEQLLVRAVARGEQWCLTPHLKSVPPHFPFAHCCCIHPILYFKNVAPLLVFGPSFWFLSPLLLNPGDGPAAGVCRYKTL